MRILSMIASRKGVILLLLGAIVLTLWAHDVPTEVTNEDETYAKHILAQAGYDHAALKVAQPADFEAEVRTIKAVQDAVLTAAPDHKGLPFHAEREPKDIFERKYGLCYDRSRAIEKILSWLGFETRHVAVYSTVNTSALQALFTPQVASHAISEALTRKGWMAVDSNARWIGLDQTRDAISIDDIQSSGLRDWAGEISAPINGIFKGAFVQIRGLYSRHGYFYPPYTPIPDFNFRQVVGNVID